MWFLLATKQSTGGCRLCWNLSGTKSLEGRITARSGAGWDGGWITRGSPCVFRVDWRKNIWGRSFGTHVSCWGGLNCWNWLNLMQISRGQFLEGFPLSRSVGVGNDPLCGFKWRSYWKNIWEHEWWWVFNTKIEGKSGELRASVAMRQIWVVCLRFRLLYDIYNGLNTCQFPAVVSSRSTTKFRRVVWDAWWVLVDVTVDVPFFNWKYWLEEYRGSAWRWEKRP